MNVGETRIGTADIQEAKFSIAELETAQNYSVQDLHTTIVAEQIGNHLLEPVVLL